MEKKDLYRKAAKYTPEEKFGLFVEGKHRVPAPQKSKKLYNRKRKHKNSGDW